MNRLKMLAVILLAVSLAAAAQFFAPRRSVAEEPGRFTSARHLAEYIRANSLLAGLGRGMEEDLRTMSAPGMAGAEAQWTGGTGTRAAAKAVDGHSTTNVQVEGVDEYDTIKNDGKYLYVVSGGQVHILEAYPPERAGILSTVKFDGYPRGLFLNGDRLLVLGDRYSAPGTLAVLYDVADRAAPAAIKVLAWEGHCVSSRMIGDWAYIVINSPVLFYGDNAKLPEFSEDGRLTEVPPGQIYFFNYPDYSYVYTMIVAVNTADPGKQADFRTYLTGTSQNVFASAENLYLTGVKVPDTAALTGRYIEGLASLLKGETAGKMRNIGSSAESPHQKMARAEELLEKYMAGLSYAEAADLEEKIHQIREKFHRDMERERDGTAIYKFSLQGGSVEFRCRGEVKGQLLNQFSMDEYEGYFRVATTSRGFMLSRAPATRNNIYVLDRDLKVTGRLEGLAPTERIYSARFMGGRVYLVTFRNIDPLFVIDLKDPAGPKVLGELKIPGYSDYLHPYDENHLIGVGREVAPVPDPLPMPLPMPLKPVLPGPVPEIMPPPPIIPQGVKIALFDVSNPARPLETAKYVVDRPHSDTEVSRDHKAFLFNRGRDLMVLPVSYTEYTPVAPPDRKISPYLKHWQGMYVFNISPAKGIGLKGRIEHPSPERPQITERISRAAYIKDVLYTVSDGAVKLSDIDDLGEIRTVRLPRPLYR